jgi:hypothetical protein
MKFAIVLTFRTITKIRINVQNQEDIQSLA